MSSILKVDNFDYLSDELFSDSENDQSIVGADTSYTSQSTQNKTVEQQRYEEKKRLFLIYMADPTIPDSQKNRKGFLMSLYEPSYLNQRIFELREKLQSSKLIPQLSENIKKPVVVEDFGYDPSFFTSKEELIAHRRQLENIPIQIKALYDTEGIVAASKVFDIEKKLNCDNEDSGNEETKHEKHEISQSLLELSIAMSEQYEVAQSVKDLENFENLNKSLNELTDKLQTSSKAAQMIEHTLSTSQKLKMLNEINTYDISIHTCDIFSDEDHRQEDKSPISNMRKETQKKDDPGKTNATIENSREEIVKIPSQVKFSFASGKSIALDLTKVAKFKNIFETDENNPQLIKSMDITNQKNSEQTNQNDINEKKIGQFEAIGQSGFVFASGKQLTINSSKLEAFQNKFKNEEAKFEENCAQIPKDVNSIENPKSSHEKDSASDINKTKSKGILNSSSWKKKTSLFTRKPKKVEFDESSVIKPVDDSNSGISKNDSNFCSTGDSSKYTSRVNEIGNALKTVGFSFASGRNIRISDQAIEKFKNIFEHEELNLKIDTEKKSNLQESQSFTKECLSQNVVKLTAIDQKSVNQNKNDRESLESQFIVNTQVLNQIENIEMIYKEKYHKSKSENQKEIPKKIGKNNEDDEFYISQSPPKRAKSRRKFKLNLSRMRNESFSSDTISIVSKKAEVFRNVTNYCDISSKSSKNKSIEMIGDQQKEDFSKFQTTNCAFTFASGKDVKLNQSKVNSFKRKFKEENKMQEESFQTSINQSKKFKLDNSFEEETVSHQQSSFRILGDSGLNSYRMNSLRTKISAQEECDVFNFNSVRTRKNSQQLTPATDFTTKVDSGIESQKRPITKISSPPKSILNKNLACFAPSYTSSPVTVQPKRRKIETTEKLIEENSYRRKPFVCEDNDFMDIEQEEDYVAFKPAAVRKFFNQNEVAISPIDRPKPKTNRINPSAPVPIQKTVSRMLFDKKTFSQRMAEFDEVMAYYSQLHLFGNDPTASQLEHIQNFEEEQTSRYKVEQSVKVQRRQVFKEQIEYVENKSEEDTRQCTGTMFMMKSGSNRKNLKDYVENEKLKCRNRHDISNENILDFKFDMRTFEQDVNLKVSIVTGDNAKLIMDENSKVGFEEIKYSFLASYGVDPKLATHQWTENAYKMIFIKFLWMENSFEKFDKFEVLTPENILLQLKYRYDREIDRHQRPALRKITEKDESPNHRIVLKVLDIVYSVENGFELELTDGWYKIRTCIDSCLAEAISTKKITVNTKLVICGAELINIFDTGYNPLELPRGVRLKIHGNSTRKAKWYEKLGLAKNPNSLMLSLNAVSHDGGNIGRLRLFIVHVYSIIYVESVGEKKEFRSEKMQNRLENKKEILYSTMYEKIHKQVVQEARDELKSRVAKIDKNKIVLDKMSIHEICDLLEYENDSDLAFIIKSQLSMLQRERIFDLYNQRKFELNQKVKERISKNENNVAQLFKFRVVDAVNPKKTALVSWWQPSEDLLDIIKVGNMIEMRKISSAGKFSALSSNEIQLHADRSSVVKLLKLSCDTGKFQKFIRGETRFSYLTKNFNPLNNEFDIACMIVYVEEKIPHEKFQKVYVTNDRMDFTIINFYPNITECAYDDILIEGKMLYIRNLQWRNHFKDNITELPEAYSVIDSTIFISNPKDKSQERRLNEISTLIGDHQEYLQKCREKLATFGINYIKLSTNDVLKTIQLNFPSAASPKSRSKRNLGMRRVPIKYRFS